MTDDLFDPFSTTPDVDPSKLPPAKPHGFRRGRNFRADLFGAASGLDPEKSGQVDGKSPRKKQPDHNERTAKYYADRGYLYVRTEWYSQRPDGFMWKRDLFGFADGLAFKGGRFKAVQIKSRDNMGEGVRDMASSKEIKGMPYRTKRENLEAFLKAGGLIEVIGWEKVGAFWQATVKEVTWETIQEVDSRRRKAA